MNKFNDILVALRNNNGVAVNGHNVGGTVKIEAIAMMGKEVVAMPEGYDHYSINSLVLREDGQVVLTSYSNAVMYPEYLRDTPQESADEFNKPENHTPGMSYRMLTDVTLIKEEKIMNAIQNAAATALGLTYTFDNPTPGAKEMGSELFSAEDNKMFLSVTPLESAEVGHAVIEAMVGGMAVVNKSGMFKMDMQTEEGKPLASLASHPAYLALMATVPDIVGSTTMMMTAPFSSKNVSGDAYSIIALSADGVLYGLTILTGPEPVSKELARSFLDGSFVMEHLSNNVETFVENIIGDDSLQQDLETYHSSEALNVVGEAVQRRFGEQVKTMFH